MKKRSYNLQFRSKNKSKAINRNGNSKRKASINFFLVSMIISVVAFVVYYHYFISIGNTISTKQEDLQCRFYTMTKDYAGDIGSYLFNLNKRCVTDKIEIKPQKEDNLKFQKRVFNTLADAEKRCWFRYGEGKYDFMGHFNKDGNWCFKCAVVEYKDKDYVDVPDFKYRDYIAYLKNKKLDIYKDGKREKVSYLNYMNLKYAKISNPDELLKTRESLNEILREGDVHFKDVALTLNEKYINLLNLYSKDIDLNNKIYVVYMYDKPSQDISKKLSSALKVGMTTMGVEMAVSLALPYIASMAMTGLACSGATATLGLLEPLCALTFVNLVEKVKNGVQAVKGSLNIEEKIIAVNNFLRDSFRVSKVAEEEFIFTGEINDIEKMETLYKEAGMVSESADLNTIQDDLSSLNIKSLSELDKNVNSLSGEKDKIEDAYKILSKDSDKLLSKDSLVTLSKDEDGVYSVIDSVTDARKELDNIQNEIKSANGEKKLRLKAKYIKIALMSLGAIDAGVMAYHYNGYSNQYVDILNEEEYYRLCGT